MVDVLKVGLLNLAQIDQRLIEQAYLKRPSDQLIYAVLRHCILEWAEELSCTPSGNVLCQALLLHSSGEDQRLFIARIE